jgi:outer membrane protein TolC
VDLAHEAIERSQLRLQRAQDNFEMGLVNRIEVLSAEVDLNTDSLSLQDALNLKTSSYRSLALEMGLEEQGFSPELVQPMLDPITEAKEQLLAEAIEQNALLATGRLQKQSAAIDYSIANRAFSPRLLANGSYNWTRVDNEAGLLVFQENTGFTGGVNLNVGLFNGFRRSIQRQNAKLTMTNAELSLERSKMDTERSLMNAWDTYQTSLQQIQLQQRSVKTAELNYERAQDLFQSGQLNAVQIRDVQLGLQSAELNLTNLTIQAFLARTELLRLTGRLVQ